MKQKILSILPMLLFTTILVNAQDVTTYRGAFAPAPTRQWTESWTNFDPINTVYPTANVIYDIQDSILTNTTWTANNVYRLDSNVYVKSGATLTIEPGTIIRGVTKRSALVICRGAKLIAEGTQCNPIVFTSNNAAGSSTRKPGDWGGIIILGNAKHNLGTNNLIEGLPNTNPNNYHGGTDDDDNSGVLKYVRIEFTGYVFSTNNEINGLTLGSVGRGTTIDYVQVSYGDDDSFEWFGGSVNAKHLIAFRGKDDDFDTDNGYSGTVQYALGIKDPNISDASNSSGFESDNSATGIDGLLPKTSAKFYNVTQIGGFRCSSNATGSGVAPSTIFQHRRGARVRRNSDLKLYNSIFMNNWRGLFVDNAVAGSNPTQPTSVNYNEDSAVFRNNIIAGDFTTTWTGTTYNGTKSLAYEDVNSRSVGLNVAYANDSLNTCSILTDAWNANPALWDFRPNTGGDGAVVTDPTNLSTGADLTPIPQIGSSLFTPNQASDFLAVVFENGGGSTNGVITVTIPKPSGWNITVPGLTLSGVAQSGTNGTNSLGDYTNGGWKFLDDGTNVIATSNTGIVLEKNGAILLGFIATIKGTTSIGTAQNLSINVSGGGDNTAANNSALIALSAN